MSFQSRIDQDIKTAMLAREAAKLSVLRMLKTALMNAAIEKGGAGSTLDDSDALAIVRKEVKKRQDSVEAFEKGGRPEMAASEKAEIEILNAYLPLQLSAAEVEALVKAAIAEAGATSKKDMGAVMKLVNAKSAGRADGRTLSAEVQKQLPA
ncbi:MAG: GatB/YqeY domain-containing protein [Verrucomicrobia bacterium]|nr:GatB/YqeY domain-containing protein [Verrucomicrobiota bacterium]